MLLVTSRAAAPGFAGLAIGIVLAAIHFVGIPLDGTSVNPARSLGPALFNGGDSLAHLWLFILAPLVGGAIAAVVAPLFGDERLDHRHRPDGRRRPRVTRPLTRGQPRGMRGPV